MTENSSSASAVESSIAVADKTDSSNTDPQSSMFFLDIVFSFIFR